MKNRVIFVLALAVLSIPLQTSLAAKRKVEAGTTCSCVCKRDADGSGTLLRQIISVTKQDGQLCEDLKGAGCRYKTARRQSASGTITGCT
jgi:hypothetical protein